MKQQINPAVAGLIVVVLIAVVGFFLYKGTGGGSTKGTMEKGNASPFAPGGAALGAPSSARPQPGRPGAPGMPR